MDPNSYNPNNGYQPQSGQPAPNGQPGPGSQNSQGGAQAPVPQYPQYPQPGPPQQDPYGQPQAYGPPQQFYQSGQSGQPRQSAPRQAPQSGYQPLAPMQPNPYSGYNPNPYPGEVETTVKKGSPNKVIFVIIAVVMVLAIAAAYGVYLLNNRGSSGKSQTGSNTQNKPADASADVVPRDDGQLDLSAKVDTVTSVKEQTVKAKTKEQINLSSGFSFMATKVEPFTPSDPGIKPGSGKQFVVVSVAVGNRAQSSTISVSYLDFKLRDNDNNVLSGHSSTQTILGNALANPTALKPGEQVAGKVVFEVNATDTDWVLIHTETYQKTTDNTTFTVEGDEVISTKSGTAASPAPPATPPATSP